MELYLSSNYDSVSEKIRSIINYCGRYEIWSHKIIWSVSYGESDKFTSFNSGQVGGATIRERIDLSLIDLKITHHVFRFLRPVRGEVVTPTIK